MKWVQRPNTAWFAALGALSLTLGTARGADDGWDARGDLIFHHVEQNAARSNVLLPIVLAEDATGFLWIGGFNGLARWDGYRPHDFSTEQSTQDGLRDHDVLALHRDARGILWVGTVAGGLARYDATRDRFVAVALSPDSGARHVSSLDDDGAGGLWVATDSGLFHLNGAGAVVAHVRHDPGRGGSLPDDKVLSVLHDRHGTVWAGTVNGLTHQVAPDGAFVPIKLPVPGGFTPEVSRLFEDSLQRIWAGTRQHGAFMIGAERGAARFIDATARLAGQDAAAEIYAIEEVAPGQIWLGTCGRGILQVDGADLQARRTVHNPMRPDSLDSDWVYALHRDRSGIVWVGTSQGLSQHASAGGFVTMFGYPGRPAGLTDANVNALMAQPDGSVWAGLGDTGVEVLDPRSVRAAMLPVQRVFSFAAWPAGQVLIGTRSFLFLADPGRHSITKLDIPRRRVTSGVFTLFGQNGALWLGGGDDGLWQLRVGNSSQVDVLRHEEAPRLTNSTVNVIGAGPDGLLAVGTDDGFNLLNPDSGVIERLFADPAVPTSLGPGPIDSFLLDRRGLLWVGTNGAGISIMTGRDRAGHPIFRHVGVAEGMPNADANKMLQDRNGLVWVSTDNGLAVIDPDTFAVRAFGRADGLGITQYWSNSGDITPQGDIIFGGVGGLTVVQPDRVTLWHYQPPVVVTDVRIGGKPVPGAGAAGLTVPAGGNSLAVEFAALDYSAPELNRYRYRLDGYDLAWVDTDASHRVASYTNLPPGDYRLRLAGSNRNGVWAGQEVTLAVHVLPAWYQTIWFRLLQAGAALLVVAAAVQGRTALLRRRQHELERQVQQRTAELSAKTAALSQSQNQLRQFAYFDTLTALPNRRAFNEALRGMIEQAPPRQFALVLIDLDGFKQVNDTQGHDGGDALLVIAANRMREIVREGDFVARLGGDEFALLLAAVHDGDVVELICERIVKTMAAPMTIKGALATIGASAGAAMYPLHGMTQEDLYKHADIALYESKRAGRGAWRWYRGDAEAGEVRLKKGLLF